MFPTTYFPGLYFPEPYFARMEGALIIPTVPGAEAALDGRRSHFALLKERSHFAVNNTRSHFSVPEE